MNRFFALFMETICGDETSLGLSLHIASLLQCTHLFSHPHPRIPTRSAVFPMSGLGRRFFCPAPHFVSRGNFRDCIVALDPGLDAQSVTSGLSLNALPACFAHLASSCLRAHPFTALRCSPRNVAARILAENAQNHKVHMWRSKPSTLPRMWKMHAYIFQ